MKKYQGIKLGYPYWSEPMKRHYRFIFKHDDYELYIQSNDSTNLQGDWWNRYIINTKCSLSLLTMHNVFKYRKLEKTNEKYAS